MEATLDKESKDARLDGAGNSMLFRSACVGELEREESSLDPAVLKSFSFSGFLFWGLCLCSSVCSSTEVTFLKAFQDESDTGGEVEGASFKLERE